ncbi:MAG: hypothetical protein R3F65_33160 [bacterium]
MSRRPVALLALAALCVIALTGAAPPDDPEALWDAARIARDHDHDPAAAAALMRRLVERHPDSRPAERARAGLAWIEARAPDEAAELWALQGPDAREGRWLYRHREAPDAALVAVRHALELDTEDALALLDRYVHDARWGFVVERAVAQRLYAEGRYVDALQAAGDDPGRRRAAIRMLVWRTAAGVGAVVMVFFGWLIWRRQSKRKRADEGEGRS